MTKIRLQKFIRDSIGISRRAADDLIRDKKVKVNDNVAELGTVIDSESDKVFLEGKELKADKELIYVALNKPAGYITSRTDPQQRRTIYKLLPDHFAHLFPVGRLDFYTEGLIILTNDGSLAFNLTHPKFEVEKEYEVLTDRVLAKEQVAQIEKGIKSEIINTSNAKVKILSTEHSHTLLRLTLHEGQNREIRKIFEVFNNKVLKLKRFRIKNLRLGSLDTGQWRLLTAEEVKDLT
ncbi:MAG TPA: pseudouridine synthase [Candidatus Saccharimonadales bacterium]|nr:pseudouridine synthase [Candidatus Saccharimonadales bacterium]